MEHRRFGWRPSTGAHHLARSLPEIRCPSLPTEISSSDRWRRKRTCWSGSRRTERGRERITTVPVLDKYGVSPDGEWVSILSPATGQDAVTAATLAVPIRGGAPVKICPPGCQAGWSSDGKFFYVWIRASAMSLGKDPRDSRAGRQITAGSAHFWNRCGCRRGWTTRRPGDRAWSVVAGARPVDIRVHQNGPAAQSVSDTAPLTECQRSLREARRLVPFLFGVALVLSPQKHHHGGHGGNDTEDTE